jgi:hypothetical protein
LDPSSLSRLLCSDLERRMRLGDGRHFHFDQPAQGFAVRAWRPLVGLQVRRLIEKSIAFTTVHRRRSDFRGRRCRFRWPA